MSTANGFWGECDLGAFKWSSKIANYEWKTTIRELIQFWLNLQVSELQGSKISSLPLKFRQPQLCKTTFNPLINQTNHKLPEKKKTITCLSSCSRENLNSLPKPDQVYRSEPQSVPFVHSKHKEAEIQTQNRNPSQKSNILYRKLSTLRKIPSLPIKYFN